MLIQDVMKCSFSQWFPILGHLSIESAIIKIDNKFKEYILSDGIILPECCNLEFPSLIPQNGYNNDDNDYEENSSQIDWSNGDEANEDGDEDAVVEFPQIEKEIRRCLRRFGDIFPKLNWSSCEDAIWVHATGTKCSDMTSVFLLLKSSDKIVHDLTEPFKYCTDLDPNNPPIIQYELILRKWININPSMEFRCFVANKKILGICQRDVRTYYEYIAKEKTRIIEDIQRFFYQNHIAEKLPLKNFVIDILRSKTDTIQLVDVNVFGELTDSLLFDWDELHTKADQHEEELQDHVDFRFIENRFGVQRGRFELNSLPLDVFNGNISNIYDSDSIVNEE